MDNMTIKSFNDMEYVCIKKVFLNDTEYRVFLNINDRKNVKITDTYLNIVKDREIIKKVAGSVFAVYSEILYDQDDSIDNSDIEYEEDGKKIIIVDGKEVQENTRRLNEYEFNSVIRDLKREFFIRFSSKTISEEELDKRITKSLKNIVLTNKFMADNCSPIGQYNMVSKEISVLSLSGKDIISADTLFHEFIHAITTPGVRKIAYVEGSDGYEFYTYGSAIDEGIVTYIQNTKRPLKYNMFQRGLGYNPERKYIGIIAQLYNFNEGKPEKRNYIEEFIQDPDNTLGRIEEIFYEEEIAKHPKGTKTREIRKASMSKALNFITDYDFLDSNEIAEKRIKETLKEIALSKVRRLKIKSKDELYDALYLIEGISLDLREKIDDQVKRDEDLEKAKMELITRYFQLHPRASMEKIIENLSDYMPDPLITAEERLLVNIFGVMHTNDPRHAGVKKAFRTYYVQKNLVVKRGEAKRKKVGPDFEDP